MKILRIIFMVMGIALVGYGWKTGTIGVIMPYLLLVMGLNFIVMGITEFQKRKANAFNLFLTAGFVLFVGVYIL
ncbi:hypothetical protein CSV71_10435 [Sporosarcina sp. P21c]|uniref:DUF3953 domain-containing protein n=1 Tax=unclassified Sporosarcina TaxID=2647733 RepID=UPI000C16B64D|nr:MULTISPECIES: DUF3953 domain-containing protein [unclassified Sporosarcina]PIC67623.1 hypothetical protein CSV78_06880 [Sporosarcina sp. P16a]PIC89331.1 hypothetical protein CSV71_10435 [Sporosarcina sp. P21c]PIC93074.1 hypothetical protein CSV70_07630 [Sporosarcina sp. P25]